MNIIYINIMNSNRVVPYLARVKSCQRKWKIFPVSTKICQQKIYCTYVHILLYIMYKENSRSDNCNAFITVKPNQEGLIISKMG